MLTSKHFFWRLVAYGSLVVAITLLIKFQLFSGFAQSMNDILFVSRPGATQIVIVAIDDTSLKAIGRWPWPRATQAKLITAIASRQPKVIGYDVTLAETTAEDQASFKNIFSLKNLVVPTNSIPGFVNYGQVAVLNSNDGKVRRLLTERDNQPAFSILVARLLGVKYDQPWLDINYRFGRNSWPMISAADLLAGQNLELLRDKMVLVGVTAPELQDIKETPLGPMNGVEVHANAVDTLMSGRTLKRFTLTQQWMLAVLLALLPILGLELLSIKKGLLLSAAGLLMTIIGSILLFNVGQIIPALWYWLVSLILGLAVAMVVRLSLVSAQQRFLKRAFSQYVSPIILQELLRHPERLALQGSTKVITVLFLDIRGFTTFSETRRPAEVVEKLNQLLAIATQVILDHGGTVDKYIGDAVMAFWGAPLSDTKQATHTCRAALTIQQRIERETAFRVGIGINHGEAVVGNVGSSQRFDYTAIGDTVNTAARLESATKEFKTAIVISQAVRTLLNQEKSSFELVDLGAIKLKGKKQKVGVWGLLADH